MSTAAALASAPLLDGAVLRDAALRLGRAARAAASCALFAAGLWLMLAGPGFTADGASTAAPRVRTAHR